MASSPSDPDDSPVEEQLIPTPALVVLIGASSSGKSTWARANFKPGQILATDDFRAFYGAGPEDQTAGTEAFALLQQLLTARLSKGLTTVIDTLGLDPKQRASYIDLAHSHGLDCVAVGFDTSSAVCHDRNGQRPFPLTKAVLNRQLKQWRQAKTDVADERFDLVVVNPGPARQIPKTLAEHSTASVDAKGPMSDAASSLAFDLVISSFDFGPDANTADIGARLVAMAQAAEAAGFRALWLMDHFRQIPQVGRAWDPMLEPYTALAYLAAATNNLRLGTLVANVEHRNVGLLAKTVATLDVLSGGRVECGLGAGWFSDEQAAYGYPVNPNRIRLDTLEEAVQALPVLWGPGSKSFVGDHVKIPEALAYPRPLQDPVPILVGGGGEQRTLRIAARFAHACNLAASDPQVVARKVNVVRQHCLDTDRDPDDLVITTLNPLIHARSGRELDALVESMRPANRPADNFAAANQAATTDEHVVRFRHLAELGVGRACVALTGNTGPERIEAFADVIKAFTA